MSADEPKLAPTTTVRRSDAQVSCLIDDETVLMHLDTGRYFGYDTVGTRVWTLLAEPLTVEDLCKRLVAEYADVDMERCMGDTIAFLRDLVLEGLVTIVDPRPAPR